MNQHESLGRLIACLYRQSRIYFEKTLAPLGLGSGTLPVLLRLLHHDGINQQALTAQLHVDKATTTRAVTKLINAGYVRREQDPTDHRAYRLFITPKAREVEPQIRRVLRAWTATLADGFTPEEQHLALALLRRMRDNALRYNSAE
jgi:DNA-binding MarR family transcriptional regulator